MAPTGTTTLGIIRLLQRPLLRTRIRHPLLFRPYSYPKEGVFQPNSPPQREIPGFGPAPPQFPNQHSPHQPPQYLPHQQQHPPNDPSQHHPSPRNPLKPRWYTILLTLTSLSYGFYYLQTRLAAFLPLAPNTPEDADLLADILSELDDFALVKQLRAAVHDHPTKGPGTPVWREYNAYQSLSHSRREDRLSTGPLAGTAGLAAQKVFVNEASGFVHVFVNFGMGTCGWPRVVHGGAISTVCDEALGRVAIRQFEGGTGVTASLEVAFHEVVRPGEWYVFVGMPVVEAEEEDEGGGGEIGKGAEGAEDQVGDDGVEEKKPQKRKVRVQGVLACLGEERPRYDDGDEFTAKEPTVGAGSATAAVLSAAKGAGGMINQSAGPSQVGALSSQTNHQQKSGEPVFAATMRDVHPHVTCKGLFVAPKGLQLGRVDAEF